MPAACRRAWRLARNSPSEPETAHQADEYMKIDTLLQNAKIFARAILLLAGQEETEHLI